MAFSKVFEKTYNAILAPKRPRYVVSRGGTRSGKTYAILQILDFLVEKDHAGDVTSVVSETLPHLKKGAIRDFETIRGTTLKDDPAWNESDHIYTYPGGGKLEFFSVDTPGKVQGPGRKRLYENEAIHLKYDTHRQLAVRTTGIIFMDYNPEQVSWIDEKILTRDDVQVLDSTYLDNDYLTEEQVREIESNRGDSNWWRVFGEGKTGHLEGLIFPDFIQVDSLPEKSDGMIETYGLDYGFTNDPTTLIHCYVDNRKKEIWLDEVCYRTGMLNEDIAAVMKQEGIGRAVRVYADSAEPKTNETIRRYGFNIEGSYKATKIAEQLQAMKGYKIYVTKRSLNLIRELRGYVWMRDKNGEWLNEPVDILNHAIDAARYAVFPVIKVHRESHSTMSRT